jgi:hypothetical protein
MGEALRLNFDRHLPLRILAALAMSFAGPRSAAAQAGRSPVIVTRAETDFHFAQTVRAGGFARLVHCPDMVPVNRQDVVRMNQNRLYSGLGLSCAFVDRPGSGRCAPLAELGSVSAGQ